MSFDVAAEFDKALKAGAKAGDKPVQAIMDSPITENVKLEVNRGYADVEYYIGGAWLPLQAARVAAAMYEKGYEAGQASTSKPGGHGHE